MYLSLALVYLWHLLLVVAILQGVEDLVIVEGEIDKLAIDEALQLHTGNPLWPRSVAVVSVPAGAPTPGSVNMEGKFRYVRRAPVDGRLDCAPHMTCEFSSFPSLSTSL